MAGVSSWVPQIWVREMVRELRPRLRLALLVNRDYQDQIQQRGDTVNVPLPPTMQAKTKTRGNPLVFDEVDVTTTPVRLDQHFYSAYQVEDIDRAQAQPDVLASYGRAAATALSQKIEAFLFSKYVDAQHAVGTAGTAFTKERLLKARTALARANAPLNEIWWALIAVKDTEGMIDALANTPAAAMQGDNSALREGRIGRLYGFDIFESNMSVEVPGTPVTTHSLAGHRDAMTMVSRPLAPPPLGAGVASTTYFDPETGVAVRVMLSYDHDTMTYKVSYDTLLGAKAIMPQLLVDLVS